MVETGSEQVMVHLGAIPANVRIKVTAAVNRSAIETQNHITRDKLSGSVLNVRTGNLRRSVHTSPATDSGDQISASVGFGHEAFYGRFHEYGVAHSWQIIPSRAKVLRFEGRDGIVHFARSVTHPGLRERSFMRTGLQDQAPRIVSNLRAAVGEGINE